MESASRSLKQTERLFSEKRILKALSISLILLILSVIFLQINIISAKENNNSLKNLINYQQTTNPPELQWNKTYGGDGADAAYSIQQTNDGGYIVAGYVTNTLHNVKGAYILKLYSNGSSYFDIRIYWGRNWNGGEAYSIQQTNDGGYIVAGYTEAGDVLILKLNSDGDDEWDKTYGGNLLDRAYSMQQTNDGGYIVAGDTNSFSISFDVYVLKLDSNGNLLWNKTYGGSKDDRAFSIQQTRDGGYILAGITSSFGNGNFDVYILKIDGTGNVLWQKTYGGSGDDEAYSIQQTNDGGYIVAGYTESFGNGNYDVYVLKLDSNGNLLWNKTYGGSNDDRAYSIQQTRDGGYIVAGYTKSFGNGYSDVYILKLDSNGNLQWQKTYGRNLYDGAYSIQQTNDGGYIVAGYTSSFSTSYDVWILKLAPETSTTTTKQTTTTQTTSQTATTHETSTLTATPTQFNLTLIIIILVIVIVIASLVIVWFKRRRKS